MRLQVTQAQRMQAITHKYRDAGEEWPATSKMIARWAIDNGLWSARRVDHVRQCAKELSAAMRQEYFTDPQGRRVRRNHVIKNYEELPDGKYKQFTFWVDFDTATEKDMEASFQLRRDYILGDCKQLRTDVSSFNDNRNANIQQSLNFESDLRESEQPTEYQPLR